jgi:methyl-accepting chemotaxis protein
MRRQLAWIMRGADRTQDAFDDHGTAIRNLQDHVDELRSTVARVDADAARIDDASQGLTARIDHLSRQIDQLGAIVERIDGTVNELVRVVAPPIDD